MYVATLMEIHTRELKGWYTPAAGSYNDFVVV